MLCVERDKLSLYSLNRAVLRTHVGGIGTSLQNLLYHVKKSWDKIMWLQMNFNGIHSAIGC